jgi:RNA polymerase sigma-70 factor (ECF subfamily)
MTSVDAALQPRDRAVDADRKRFAAGDERALEECQRRYRPRLLALARRIVGPNDAEDVVQTALIEAWRARERYDPARPLEPWLLTIVRRRAIDALRRQNVLVVPLEGARELSGEDGRETAERFAVVVDVRRALNELPDIQREALLLSHFAGMRKAR